MAKEKKMCDICFAIAIWSFFGHWSLVIGHLLRSSPMSWFIVDVEADGPIPAKYSMVSFGVIQDMGLLRSK